MSTIPHYLDVYQCKDRYYVGDILNGLPHGEGTLSSHQFTYFGEFNKGLFHGNGYYAAKSGVNCKGNFENGEFKHGKFITKNKTNIYKGSFDKEKFLGSVTWTDNSKVFKGIVTNNFTVMDGTVSFTNGYTFKGKIVDGYFFEGQDNTGKEWKNGDILVEEKSIVKESLKVIKTIKKVRFLKSHLCNSRVRSRKQPSPKQSLII